MFHNTAPHSRILRGTGLRLGMAAGLMLLALVTYHGSLGAPLSSDGRFLTYQNEYVRDPGGLVDFWTADFFEGAITHGVTYKSGYYRPVTNTIFWLEYRIAGRHDGVYHLLEVLLHGLNAFLVFLLCLRIARSRLVAAAAAVFFAVHPVHAFAATEPAAQADVLFALFYLTGLLVFDRALDAGRLREATGRIGLATAICLLTALSKEMGVTLPAAFVLLVLFRHFKDGLKLERVWWTGPAWGVFVVYLVWRFGVLDLAGPTIGYGEVYSPLVLGLGAVKGVLIQISRILVPLGAGYPELNPALVNFVAAPLNDPLTYVSLILVLSLVVVALLWRWSPFAAFWSGFFLVTYSPLLRIDNIAGSLDYNILLTQERWIYLPSVAVAACLGWGVGRLVDKRPRAAPVVLGGVVVLSALLGIGASVHARSYADPFARLRRLYLLPEDRLGRMDRANKLLLYSRWVAAPMGDLQEAAKRAREAVGIVPDSPIPAAALGEILVQAGEWEEAIAVLTPWLSPPDERLARFHETNFRVYDDINRVNPLIVFLLARAHAGAGDGKEAARLLCEAARRDYDRARIQAALREDYALNGPPGCDGAADRAECMAGARLPGSTMAIGTCSAWEWLFER